MHGYPIAMQVIRDYQYVRPEDRGASAAIGNFDGVHIGHQAVIEIARSAAPDAPLGILTFEPHPREFFAPDAAPFRLMNAEAKANRLEKIGVEKLYELNFNTVLSTLTAEQFVERVIVDGLGLAHVVIGADFCFGKGRAGNAETMQSLGAKHGFGVTIAELITADAGLISSTNIRNALSEGAPAEAAKMLGHLHRLEGEIIRGDQRGRDLGYPTANMSIDGLHPPKFGVYAVHVDVLSGPHTGTYQGASSIGVRPMFGENHPNCETFLFDFQGDLYGEHISVALVEYLRGEEKFDSLEALIAQMDADCATARKILSQP